MGRTVTSALDLPTSWRTLPGARHDAATRLARVVAAEGLDLRAHLAAHEGLEEPRHPGVAVEEGRGDHEVVAFGLQGDEGEAEEAGDGLHAHPGVGPAFRDAATDLQVRA